MQKIFATLCLLVLFAHCGWAQTAVSPQTTVLQVRYKVTSNLTRGWKQVILDPCAFRDDINCYEDEELSQRTQWMDTPEDGNYQLHIVVDESFIWDKAKKTLQRVITYDDCISFYVQRKNSLDLFGELSGKFRKVEFLQWKPDILDDYYLWKNPYDLTDQRFLGEALAARLYDGEIFGVNDAERGTVVFGGPEQFTTFYQMNPEVLKAIPLRYKYSAATAQQSRNATHFDYYHASQRQIVPIALERNHALTHDIGKVKYEVNFPPAIADSLISAVNAGILRPFLVEQPELFTRMDYDDFTNKVAAVKAILRKKFPGQEDQLGKFLKIHHIQPLRYLVHSDKVAIGSGILTDLNHSQPFSLINYNKWYSIFFPDINYFSNAISLTLPAELTGTGKHLDVAVFSWREIVDNVLLDNPGIAPESWQQATIGRAEFWRNPLTEQWINLTTPEGSALLQKHTAQRNDVLPMIRSLQGKSISAPYSKVAEVYPDIAAVAIDTDHPTEANETLTTLPRLWGVSPLGKSKLPKAITSLKNLFYIDLTYWEFESDNPADWQELLDLLQQTGKPLYFLTHSNYTESELKPLQQRLYVQVSDDQLKHLLRLPKLPTNCMRFVYDCHFQFKEGEQLTAAMLTRLPYVKTLSISAGYAWGNEPQPPPVQLPENLGELMTLTRLTLTNVANLPASLVRLVNLEDLSIKTCSANAAALNPILPALKNLTRLELSHFNLQGLVFTGNLKLETLRLVSVPELPASLANLVRLKQLDVSKTPLTDAIFSPQMKLEKLNISEATRIPATIANLAQLKTLEVRSSPQADWKVLNQLLPALKNLTSLSFHHNKLTSLPTAIEQLQQLERLSVYGEDELPEAEIERLRLLLPNCKIGRDFWIW